MLYKTYRQTWNSSISSLLGIGTGTVLREMERFWRYLFEDVVFYLLLVLRIVFRVNLKYVFCVFRKG